MLGGWLPWEVFAFMCSLAFYHLSEFTIAFVYNRPLLSADSWLLSPQYCAAMAGRCRLTPVDRAWCQR